MAIGRIERALSRIEQAPRPTVTLGADSEVIAKHERLKSEAKAALADLDQLLSELAQ